MKKKRMLVNATHAEEVRVALVDGQHLYDLDIEHRIRQQKKSNVYKGKITRVEPSLEAAFVDYGAERHGFLPLKEISREYFTKDPRDIEGRLSIREVVREGQEVIIQVQKDERGTKGAALTTFISLAGRYLVLMPNNPRAGGISRRIEGEERAELKDALSSLEIPNEMGVIVRTAGVGRSSEELGGDFDYLIQVWAAIKDAAANRKAPFLIYQESNVILRTIRDCLRQDISEILIDHETTYQEALDFIRAVMPHYESKLKLYTDPIPLFSRFQIESQIETAFQREVKLPSGGSIVIDPTEALVSIDINSARSTKGSDLEETALHTNLEAAEEIARQLRLRDIGGLIVVDFIDMLQNRHQREVESRMRAVLELDRARVQVSRISRFGLMELSRQRLRASLEETLSRTCPRCNGLGTIRDVRSLSLSIMRIIEEEAMKDGAAEILAQLPVDVATYLLNEKRDSISEIESQHDVRVLVVPNPHMDSPHYEISRKKSADVNQQNDNQNSYDLIQSPEADDLSNLTTSRRESVPERAAVSTIQPATNRGNRSTGARKESAALNRFSNWLSGLFRSEDTDDNAAPQTPSRSHSGGHTSQRNDYRNRNGERGGEDRAGGRGQNRQGGNRQGSGRNRGRNNPRNDNRRRDRDDQRQQRYNNSEADRSEQNQTDQREQSGQPTQRRGRDRDPGTANNRRRNNRDQRRGGRNNRRPNDRSPSDRTTAEANAPEQEAPISAEATQSATQESHAANRPDSQQRVSTHETPTPSTPTASGVDQAASETHVANENQSVADTQKQPVNDSTNAPQGAPESQGNPAASTDAVPNPEANAENSSEEAQGDERQQRGRNRRGSRGQGNRSRSRRGPQNRRDQGDRQPRAATEQTEGSTTSENTPAPAATVTAGASPTDASQVNASTSAPVKTCAPTASPEKSFAAPEKTEGVAPAAKPANAEKPKRRGRASNDPRLRRRQQQQEAAANAEQKASEPKPDAKPELKTEPAGQTSAAQATNGNVSAPQQSKPAADKQGNVEKAKAEPVTAANNEAAKAKPEAIIDKTIQAESPVAAKEVNEQKKPSESHN